ncbi:MAG: hypothetical protein HYY22_11350 [Thaumarchaeota archaeon]|nr:hypothetical protein [Nitrososphaerota archaeon]
MNKKKIAVIASLAIVIAIAAPIAYQYYYLSSSSRIICPNLFADVSYPATTGFTAVTHPKPHMTEFVLRPNSTGMITVSYSSPMNDLTSNPLYDEFLIRPFAVRFNLTSDKFESTDELNITSVTRTVRNSHLLIVNYTFAAGPKEDLYWIGFPSTCRSALVYVREQPYNGPLPWDNKRTF